MKTLRHYSSLDRACLFVDQVLKSLSGTALNTNRVSPARDLPEPSLTEAERKQSAAVMRINHAGEICAQALYQGQACVTNSLQLKQKMQQAAVEEGDHLHWCTIRLQELNSRPSYFAPLWYAGSLVIGAAAGLAGDRWSLGFLAETETQVIQHLQNQLILLPAQDIKSYKILEQMKLDEAHHREDAIIAGGKELPDIIKQLMNFFSKVMVKTSRIA